MFEEVLYPNAKKSLDLLGGTRILPEGTYLAGGTALALQLGHRYSFDFDFFTPKNFREDTVIKKIAAAIPSFRLERQAEGTILGSLGDTRFSLFFYEYPLLFRPHQFRGIPIADVKDIVPMKITAIADRGIKRDFIDLYFLIAEAKIVTLQEALTLYDKKFKKLAQNKMHILMSLAYFDDAEETDMPRMIKPVSWTAVKKFFISEQKRIAKELLRLP